MKTDTTKQEMLSLIDELIKGASVDFDRPIPDMIGWIENKRRDERILKAIRKIINDKT